MELGEFLVDRTRSIYEKNFEKRRKLKNIWNAKPKKVEL